MMSCPLPGGAIYKPRGNGEETGGNWATSDMAATVFSEVYCASLVYLVLVHSHTL